MEYEVEARYVSPHRAEIQAETGSVFTISTLGVFRREGVRIPLDRRPVMKGGDEGKVGS